MRPGRKLGSSTYGVGLTIQVVEQGVVMEMVMVWVNPGPVRASAGPVLPLRGPVWA